MNDWRKSSHSTGGGSDGTDCVELANLGTTIGIRDSKAPMHGNLSVPHASFVQLAEHIRQLP
ncbi:DUF397 domain-containing protein [Actinomadura harenae]|uniref:DUF397 domain-containing protein n=1 Tax=Actinomadura harenae TaxID=2483351 RepID=A0A3M2LRW5_9ACTN|nr:DUF397 domain-containing protein [Actinomadura harenae]RMI40194.1 DUF397 domain-containing protein [Actinomadura harenae]